jgi:hypothetical protein
MQEDVDNYTMLSPQWAFVVEHYWWKRFTRTVESATDRYRKAVMKTIRNIACQECSKRYSMPVNSCWKCHSYTCGTCAEIILRPDYPRMDAPTTCVEHTTRCGKCRAPFIATSQETHCFECQYLTDMFTVKWDRWEHDKLPYGKHALKQTFKKYIEVVRISDSNNIETNSIAMGVYPRATAVSSMAIGYGGGRGANYLTTTAGNVYSNGYSVNNHNGYNINNDNYDYNNVEAEPKVPTRPRPAKPPFRAGGGGPNPTQRKKIYMAWQKDLAKWKEENE